MLNTDTQLNHAMWSEINYANLFYLDPAVCALVIIEFFKQNFLFRLREIHIFNM